MTSRPVLVLADWEAPGTFDPHPPTTLARLRADSLVFGRLWITDPAGRRVPDLAVAVPRPAAGGLTITLRPSLRWSDGSPLTAADVVRSCARQVPGVGATALDARRVRFATSDAGSLDTLFITPVAPTGEVASGPFRLASATASELRFEQNPYYHGSRPRLTEIDEVVPVSHDAMLLGAQGGGYDYLPHLGPADLGGTFGALRPITTTTERVEMLVPTGLDPRTAAALSLAADRPDLSAQVFGARALPVGGPASPTLARRLLAGLRAEVSLRTLCDDPVRDHEVAVLAARWAAFGIVVHPSCSRLAQLLSTPAGPSLALYADQAGAMPAGAIPLVRWPALRAVSPHLHGFVPNDTSATDLWNAASWWLS